MTQELILGPPGTGKTTALLDIVEKEISSGTSPQKIGFVSFTRRAADEASDRAMSRFGLARDELPWFRTLHSACYRVLGVRQNEVLTGKSMREFARWIGIDVSGKWAEDGTLEGFTSGDRMLHMEHLARVRCVPLRRMYDEDDDGLSWSDVERVARGLHVYKEQNGLLDYTDMLSQFLALGSVPRLDVLLVDEVQDLSALQWRVVRHLSRECPRVVLAGDDDQAIYRWAGADVEEMLGMSCASRVLGQSYRVPRAIQELANATIGRVSRRRQKSWNPRAEDGTVLRESSLDHVDLESGEILVLARNTYLVNETIVPELRRRGIYFSWRGQNAIEEDVLRDISVWERLRSGKTASIEEVLAVYARMSQGRGYMRGHRSLGAWKDRSEQVTLEDLWERGGLITRAIWHEALDKLPPADVEFILAARRRGERLVGGTPRVRVSTIHGAKGGEADHVVLMTDLAARTAREAENNPDDEHRVFYVGATRARNQLTIIAPREKNYYSM